jgi:hypothetical protein
MGRISDASAHFQRAIAIEPNNLSVRVTMALNKSETGAISIGNIAAGSPDSIEFTDRTVRIPYKRNSVSSIELKKGDVLQADVEVVEGGCVNILLLSEGEFRRYTGRAPFQYYPDATMLNTRRLSFSIKIPQNETHCLIIENSGFTAGGAEPDILNSGGVTIVRVQAVVAIPGTMIKPLSFFGPSPKSSVPEWFGKVIPPVSLMRKRRVKFASF